MTLDPPAGAVWCRSTASSCCPSTGAFDSPDVPHRRSTLAERGHTVTVVARLGPGLAADERHPAGYRILSVPVSATDGLPWPLRWLVGRHPPPAGRGEDRRRSAARDSGAGRRTRPASQVRLPRATVATAASSVASGA